MFKSKGLLIVIGGMVRLTLANIIWRRTRWYKEQVEDDKRVDQEIKENAEKMVKEAFSMDEMKKEQEKMNLKMEEIKKEIEEGKRNDMFSKELKAKINMANRMANLHLNLNKEDAKRVNEELKSVMDEFGMKAPWGDEDFSKFMANPNNRLDFSLKNDNFEQSIRGARDAGAPEEKILHDKDEIDDFFME